MIITYWILVSYLLDTPERRMKLIASELANAIQAYINEKKAQEVD